MLKKEPQFEGIGASLPSSWEGILSSAPKSISAQFNSAFDQHTIRLFDDMAALGSKMQASRYENAYLFADKEFAERRLSSERLAYSKQGDRSFFRRLQAEGLTDPRRAHIPAPSEVVHAVMASGRSEVKAGTGLWSSLVRGARRLRGV